MNRRRIGLAALVVGIGALVRRRLRAEVDPGPTDEARFVAAESRVRRDEPSRTSSEIPTGGLLDEVALDENVSLGEPEIVDSSPKPASAGPVEHVTLGAPTIDDAGVADVDLGEPMIGDFAAPAEATAEAPPAKSMSESGESAEAENVADAEPENTTDMAEVPRIALPTMPRAGTSEIARSGSDTRATAVGRPGGSLATGMSSGGDVPPTPPTGSAGASTPAGASAMSTPGHSESHTTAEPTTLRDPLPSSPQTETSSNARRVWYRRRSWRIAGGVLGTIVILAVIAASVIRLPYYSLRPGSVYNTIERVEAPGDLVSIPNGEISFVTVAQTANISPWQWIDAKLDGNVRIRHEDEVRGDQTADELREADVRRMQVSKDAAVVVALQRLGYDLVITPIGIEVAQVFPCTAADGALGTGDLIIGVNGTDVRDGEQLVAALTEIGIGEDVELLVERIDPSNPTQSMRTDLVNLTLGSADAACLPDDVRADEPRPFIGIGTLTIVDEEFPIDIDVRTGSVGGPSAGLAFTLAIIDVLSEGELTNGMNIVATGTIDRDGNVGPVGGIQQKTVAAERSGADVFIVPACCDNFVSRSTGEPLDMLSNYEEALATADDITVIGVNTLDEALAAIGELGGDVDKFITVTE